QLLQLGRADEFVERDELQAGGRADVGAAAAEDAPLAVEDRVHAAVQAARRLAPGERLGVALLDHRPRVGQPLLDAQDGDGVPPRLLVVLLPAVALDDPVDLDHLGLDPAAGDVLVDAAGRLLAAGDGVDHRLGAVG